MKFVKTKINYPIGKWNIILNKQSHEDTNSVICIGDERRTIQGTSHQMGTQGNTRLHHQTRKETTTSSERGSHSTPG